MTAPRSHAASVVIGPWIIVIGGGTDSIEILMDVGQCPLQMDQIQSSFAIFSLGHSSLVYHGKLIVIGGYNASKSMYSQTHILEYINTTMLLK
jgi:hypothetical protein